MVSDQHHDQLGGCRKIATLCSFEQCLPTIKSLFNGKQCPVPGVMRTVQQFSVDSLSCIVWAHLHRLHVHDFTWAENLFLLCLLQVWGHFNLCMFSRFCRKGSLIQWTTGSSTVKVENTTPKQGSYQMLPRDMKGLEWTLLIRTCMICIYCI